MINELRAYRDDRNNVINYDGKPIPGMKITFLGSNNTLNVDKNSKMKGATFTFDCNNGTCTMGNSAFSGMIRIGQDCVVEVGNNIYFTAWTYLSTAEGSSVKIGDDCMIASGVELRSDDAHPFFDISSGKRLNLSRDIIIGNHVWIAAKAAVLGGGEISEGSILGYGSILKSKIPNNCVAVGIPARVVKKNIAWEPPHLNLATPFYKLDASTVKKSKYWNATKDSQPKIKQHKASLGQRIKLALTILVKGYL